MNALDGGSSSAAGAPPGRVVTLLFTDLVGSTELLDEVGEPAWEATLQSHLALLAATVAETGGRVVKSLGDGLMVEFVNPAAAVRCALRMQEVAAGQQGTDAAPNLRIGLHAGEALRQGDDLAGAAVVVAKRLKISVWRASSQHWRAMSSLRAKGAAASSKSHTVRPAPSRA